MSLIHRRGLLGNDMRYAELFCQSHFSFLTGASSPGELVLQAEFLRYSAIAITDECSVAGVVRAYTAIRDNSLNIKLIVGSFFKLADELEVVLLCPSRKAYAELCRIITQARRRAEKGQYVLSEWDLMTAKHCLIIWLPSMQANDQHWAAWLQKYHQTRLWIGLRRYLDRADNNLQKHCQSLSQQFNIPTTACGGILMHSAVNLPLQHVMTAIKHNTSVEQIKGGLLPNAERSLRTKVKLKKLFKAQCLAQSVMIADLCQFDLSELQYEYPSELVPSGYSAMSYLKYLVQLGLTKLFADGVSDEIQGIIHKELTLIE